MPLQMKISYCLSVKKPDNVSDSKWLEFHKGLSDLVNSNSKSVEVLGLQPLDWNLTKDASKPFFWKFTMEYDEYSLDFAAENLQTSFIDFANANPDFRIDVTVDNYNWSE